MFRTCCSALESAQRSHLDSACRLRSRDDLALRAAEMHAASLRLLRRRGAASRKANAVCEC
eukprot:944445-Pleurochrysis_carterae.AAC.1